MVPTSVVALSRGIVHTMFGHIGLPEMLCFVFSAFGIVSWCVCVCVCVCCWWDGCHGDCVYTAVWCHVCCRVQCSKWKAFPELELFVAVMSYDVI